MIWLFIGRFISAITTATLGHWDIGDGECLGGGSERFEAEVEAQKNRLLDRGLSARATLYRRSLEQRLIGSQKRLPGLLPSGPANRFA
jgi:hypothetical protein